MCLDYASISYTQLINNQKQKRLPRLTIQQHGVNHSINNKTTPGVNTATTAGGM